LEENNIAEILKFLESMETPDLSRVEEFLQARGVSAEKLQAAYGMLEQMGIRYDSMPDELPERGELMSMFDHLSSGLDHQTRRQFADIMNRKQQQARLNSSEDVISFLKSMKKE
jgi:phage tail tape-measure protein